MKKYQKLLIGIVLLFFIFGFVNIKTVKAMTIEEIKAQIVVMLEKIAKIQKQLDELIKNEATQKSKSIAIAFPNGGEKWEVGKTYDIKWNITGYSSDSSVQIKLLDERYDQSSNASEIVITNTTNSGIYSWKIPDLLNGYELYGSLYKIMVYIGEGNDKKSDTSDNYFIITKPMFPYLNVISPNGGESWEAGKSYTIKWDSLGLENYKVHIALERQNITQLIINQDVPNNSYYNWNVPQSLWGSDYKVSISIRDNQWSLMAQDSSNNIFSIVQGTIGSKIKLQLASISDFILDLFKKIKESIIK